MPMVEPGINEEIKGSLAIVNARLHNLACNASLSEQDHEIIACISTLSALVQRLAASIDDLEYVAEKARLVAVTNKLLAESMKSRPLTIPVPIQEETTEENIANH